MAEANNQKDRSKKAIIHYAQIIGTFYYTRVHDLSISGSNISSFEHAHLLILLRQTTGRKQR
jgi:hypothetical protein